MKPVPNQRKITPVTSIAGLLDNAGAVAASKTRIDRLADLLAEEMSRLHGLNYRIQIDHTPGVQFVFVVPKCAHHKNTRTGY